MPKEGIHPKYDTIHVKCACGNAFETRSTHKGDIVVEICSACHPFFTGKQKLVDTAGRVERFRRKVANADAGKAAQPQPKPKPQPRPPQPNNLNRYTARGLRQRGGLSALASLN